MSTTWTTRDGRVLLVAWMDSAHLINTFNMLARKLNLREDTAWGMSNAATAELQGLVAIRDEIKSRGMFLLNGNKQPAQIISVDVPREDFKTMCMLRAILDTKPANVEEIIEMFHRNPVRYSTHVLTSADPKWTPVVVKFTEYRLSPPGQWR